MDIARLWRQQPSNLRLIGSRCPSCEAYHFPRRSRCTECSSHTTIPYQFSGRGKILSLTTVYEAPQGFAGQVPYLAALVRLEEGPVIPAMITDIDPEEAVSGMAVEMVTRRISCDNPDAPIRYGYKFVPEDPV